MIAVFDPMNRRPWLLLPILVAVVLAACTPSEDVPLTKLAGPVVGYDGTANLAVLGVAFTDWDTTLASGTLFPEPNARVQADLTPLSEVPSSAFSEFSACPEVTITPANLEGTAFVELVVLDGDVAVGELTYLNFDPRVAEPATGDAWFIYYLANAAGSIRGTCDDETYDLDLAQGWNVIRWRIDAVDQFGDATKMSYKVVTPPSNAAWYVGPFGTLGVNKFALPR